MSSRDAILASVRAHLPKLERAEPLVPMFDDNPPVDLLAAFGQALEQMGGVLLTPDATDALAPVRARLKDAKVVCSRVAEIEGNKPIGPETKSTDLADVDYGIVRAAFGVAETGSVCLSETELGVNTLGYLPQHLIVLLDPAEIVPNIHHAYRRREFREAHYAVFQTGPSATADIEGVLIHGAQGVRSLSVLPLPRRWVHEPQPVTASISQERPVSDSEKAPPVPLPQNANPEAEAGLDEALDESFPASDPPSQADPAHTITSD